MQSYSKANKRYKQAFWPVMGVYVVLCFAGPLLLKSHETPPAWLAASVAVLTALPVVAVLFLKLRLLRETDEYTRFRQAQNMLIGAALTVSFCAVWGFLELFELAPKLWTFLVAPIYFASWGLTCLFNREGASAEGSEQ